MASMINDIIFFNNRDISFKSTLKIGNVHIKQK